MTINWETEKRFWDTYGRTGPFKGNNFIVQAQRGYKYLKSFEERHPEAWAYMQGLSEHDTTSHKAGT